MTCHDRKPSLGRLECLSHRIWSLARCKTFFVITRKKDVEKKRDKDLLETLIGVVKQKSHFLKKDVQVI